jgi:hypothetical protein
MTRRRAIKAVLHNFLGTYTSRYSDYEGYWLFGMLVADLGEVQIDLLRPGGDVGLAAPVAAAVQLATQRFREQMAKAGIPVSRASEARLNITRLPDPRSGAVNGRICVGHDVRFLVQVVSDHGKTYESETCVFVAPHDSRVEQRSTRWKNA